MKPESEMDPSNNQDGQLPTTRSGEWLTDKVSGKDPEALAESRLTAKLEEAKKSGDLEEIRDAQDRLESFRRSMDNRHS